MTRPIRYKNKIAHKIREKIINNRLIGKRDETNDYKNKNVKTLTRSSELLFFHNY